MTAPIRLGVAGCGGIANAHLGGYHTLWQKGDKGFVIAAVCDPLETSARQFAGKVAEFQGSPPAVYTTVEAMLAAESLDGVDICAPHGLHHVVAVACLEAKAHVMVEKPIGVTVAASRAIEAAAAKNQRFAATAENCRRYLGQRAVEWAINTKGLIGEPRLFYAISVGWRPPSAGQPWRWRADRYLGGGGMVMDSGAHWVDTLRYFFGEVESVYAQIGHYERRILQHPEKGPVEDSREDSWTAILTFQNGLVGTWAWTIAAPGKGGSLVSFHGSKGSIDSPGEVFHPFAFADSGEVQLLDGTVISLPQLKEMYLASLSPSEKDRLFPHGIYDGFVLEVHDFIDAIRNNRPPEIDVAEGLRSKAIAEAIYESALRGQAVAVADVLSGSIGDYQRDINEYWGL